MAINDGGPAFSGQFVDHLPEIGEVVRDQWPGLSLRDYFAARCPEDVADTITGGTVATAAAFIGINSAEYNSAIHWPVANAKARYVWADEMIKARSE